MLYFLGIASGRINSHCQRRRLYCAQKSRNREHLEDCEVSTCTLPE